MNAKRVKLGRRMCERLNNAIHASTPEGLGAWPEAWRIAGPASADFMELLTRWEDTGDKSLLPEIRASYDDVLTAWKDAAARWEREAA